MVESLPEPNNSNACSLVVEDLQRFELSQLLSLDVLPFLKLLFHKFVIPSESELSDNLCLAPVVGKFEQH